MTTIVMPEQDIVDAYELTAVEFFREVLDLDFGSCFVSDISHLSDFALSALPAEVASGNATLEQLYDAWDAMVFARIKQRYGVELKTTNILLVNLFEQIEGLRNRKVH